MNNKKLHSSQIVYLDHKNDYLYGEVIDMAEQGNLCWVRPILLSLNVGEISEEITVIDLRFTADLLIPESFFQLALDVDFINLFAKLEPEEYEPEKLSYAHKQLSLFMNKFLMAKLNLVKNNSQ